MHRTANALSSVLLVAGVLLAAGCSSGPDAAATANSMERLNLETAKVNDAIDKAVSSLKALVESPGDNLRGSYDEYSKSVTALEGQAEVVRTRADEMKARGEEFFKDWEEGSGTGLSAETQGKLNAGYAKIKEQMISAKDAFTPFLSSLKDVRSMLGLDLTAKGLENAAPIATKARDNAAVVKARITSAMDGINSVSGLLSKKPAS
jgi:hypothetical protein